MKTVFKFIVDRLKERSTWLGLVAILTSLGVSLNPEVAEYIVTGGTALGGLIFALFPDKGTEEKPVVTQEADQPK